MSNLGLDSEVVVRHSKALDIRSHKEQWLNIDYLRSRQAETKSLSEFILNNKRRITVDSCYVCHGGVGDVDELPRSSSSAQRPRAAGVLSGVLRAAAGDSAGALERYDQAAHWVAQDRIHVHKAALLAGPGSRHGRSEGMVAGTQERSRAARGVPGACAAGDPARGLGAGPGRSGTSGRLGTVGSSDRAGDLGRLSSLSTHASGPAGAMAGSGCPDDPRHTGIAFPVTRGPAV